MGSDCSALVLSQQPPMSQVPMSQISMSQPPMSQMSQMINSENRPNMMDHNEPERCMKRTRDEKNERPMSPDSFQRTFNFPAPLPIVERFESWQKRQQLRAQFMEMDWSTFYELVKGEEKKNVMNYIKNLFMNV